MDKAWIVVANQTRARIFTSANRVGPLQEIEDLVHPEGRLHARDLTTDLPGRNSNNSGPGRHAMASHQDVKGEEARRFAREVAQVVNRARQDGRFEHLHIAAEPAFMGLLRSNLDAPTGTMVTSELGRNLVTQDVEEIRSHLPDFL